jgi:hypothetical protein
MFSTYHHDILSVRWPFGRTPDLGLPKPLYILDAYRIIQHICATCSHRWHIPKVIWRSWTLLLVYFNFTVKINNPNRKKTYNVDEMRVVNTDRFWICRKINFQLEAFVTVTMTILNKWLAEGRWRRYVLGLLYNSRKLRLSLKLGFSFL